MEDNNIPVKPCSGTTTGFHQNNEYGKVGISPCGEYVSHESDKPCNIIDNPPAKNTEPTDCTCRSEACPCGSFISHKASEPCTAIA